MSDEEIDAILAVHGWEFNAGLIHLVGRSDDDSIVDWEEVLAALPDLSLDALDNYMRRKSLPNS